MTDVISRRGSCLCGAVTMTAKDLKAEFDACHCSMCRKWGGGPLLAVDCASGVSFEGEASIGVFSSSDWADRGFCRNCGTHLFYRLKSIGQYHVPMGLFDGSAEMTFKKQIFVEEKPESYGFVNDTSMMTGAEAFAQFAGES